jgi:pectate lyase
MKGLMGCVVALALVAGSSGGAQQKDAELDNLVQQYVAAWNRADAKAVGSGMAAVGFNYVNYVNYVAGDTSRPTAPVQPAFRLDHLPSFPGAEGYGSMTRGGRGGRVIAVTNPGDSGPGSLRAAVEAEGPRIVVFRVSGTIQLKSTLTIRHPFITIAGQTAPGDGITLRDQELQINADEVIIRYIRVRLGDESGVNADAITGRYNKNIILDHVSTSWGTDEVLSLYHNSYVTIQHSIISEAIGNGETHKFGGIWGDDYSTYHHNLIAHNDSRNPRFASGAGHVDFRNNVIYNWGYNSAYGGEKQQPGSPKFNVTIVNMVANYYKPGPATRSNVSSRIVGASTRDGDADIGGWCVSDNVVEGSPEVTADNWLGVTPSRPDLIEDLRLAPAFRLAEPWPAMKITQQSAHDAYRTVLARVGASLRRDPVDARIVEEVRTGTATYGDGIISSQTDVGGWPELESLPAPADSDGDGMPDWWELKHGLDPNDPSDTNGDLNGSGYTNIEEYLNGTDPRVYVDYRDPVNNVNTLTAASLRPPHEQQGK